MLKAIWDIIVRFAFSPLGVTLISTLYAAAMAVLTKLTESLSVYSPLSYGIVVTTAFALMLCILAFAKFAFGDRFYKGATYLEFSYDGHTTHYVEKKNIWGWQTECIQAVQNEITKELVKTFWFVSVCFKNPVSADTIVVHHVHAGGQNRVPFELINFEAKYSNIEIWLEAKGTYKIEYKPHE